jgi:hypothetical protein
VIATRGIVSRATLFHKTAAPKVKNKLTKARELHIKSAKWNVGEKRVQKNFISEHKQTYQIL